LNKEAATNHNGGGDWHAIIVIVIAISRLSSESKSKEEQAA